MSACLQLRPGEGMRPPLGACSAFPGHTCGRVGWSATSFTDNPGRPARPESGDSPARILPRQPLHQRPHLVRDRRPSRRVRIGPFLPHQAPVPGQQGAWGQDPVPPQAPGQQPDQGGEHGAVSPVRPWGTCRRKTATSCRSTMISASLAASFRVRSNSQPNTRTMNK